MFCSVYNKLSFHSWILQMDQGSGGLASAPHPSPWWLPGVFRLPELRGCLHLGLPWSDGLPWLAGGHQRQGNPHQWPVQNRESSNRWCRDQQVRVTLSYALESISWSGYLWLHLFDNDYEIDVRFFPFVCCCLFSINFSWRAHWAILYFVIYSINKIMYDVDDYDDIEWYDR